MLTPEKVRARTLWKTELENKRLVYAMEQGKNLKVKEMPGSRAAKQFYNLGICFGISLRWMELRSRGMDFEYQTVDNVGICHAVSNQTYFLQLEYATSDTSIVSQLKKLNFNVSPGVSHLSDLSGSNIALVAPKRAGSFAYFASQRHAMALQRTSKAYHFFDPNWGHFRAESLTQCRSVIERVIHTSGYKGPFEAYNLAKINP